MTTEITRALSILVSDRLYAALIGKAREVGRTPTRYAQELFEAAWSARCAPTGDRDLDAAVASIDRRGEPPHKGSGGRAPDDSRIAELEAEAAALRLNVANLKHIESNLQRALGERQQQVMDLNKRDESWKAEVAVLQERLADQADRELRGYEAKDAEIATLTIDLSNERAARALAVQLIPDDAGLGEEQVAPPTSTGPTAIQIKNMRGFKAAGWSNIEIAVAMGVPKDDVAEALAAPRRRRA